MRIELTIALLASVTASTMGCSDEPRRRPPITTENPDGGSRNAMPNNSMNGGDAGHAASGSSDASPGDADVSDDAMADVGNDSGGTDTMNGEVCPYPDPGMYPGFCDIVNDEGCNDPELCLVVLLINGPDVDVIGECVESDRHTLPEDADCDGTEQRCAPGTFCVDPVNRCVRLCYLDTGEGCPPDEFCRRPSSDWQGLGYCADSCD